MVVEYCRFGNLSNYLRRYRASYIGRTRRTRIVSKEFDDFKERGKTRSTADEADPIDAASVSGESAFVDGCEENRFVLYRFLSGIISTGFHENFTQKTEANVPQNYFLPLKIKV